MLNHQASFADRPLSKKELTRNKKDIATISGQRTVLINKPKIKVDLTKYVEQHMFFFDNVFDTKATNEEKKLFAREDKKKNVVIAELQEYSINNNINNLMQVFDYGNTVRSTGSTSANEDSSRSHAILQIVLKYKKNRKSKLRFIDLVGRECGADIGDADKQTRMEGAEINKSFFSSNYLITSEEVLDSVVIYCIKTPTQAMK
ncbi:28331_t:CDS:2, partial [Gigaspora margarita]